MGVTDGKLYRAVSIDHKAAFAIYESGCVCQINRLQFQSPLSIQCAVVFRDFAFRNPGVFPSLEDFDFS